MSPKKPRFEVGWSYPTSPNAIKFGFNNTGCWTVSVLYGTEPPEALAGFADRPDAEIYKINLLSVPWYIQAKKALPVH